MSAWEISRHLRVKRKEGARRKPERPYRGWHMRYEDGGVRCDKAGLRKGQR